MHHVHYIFHPNKVITPRTFAYLLFQLISVLALMALLLGSKVVYANPFVSSPSSPSGISCPANHKMYYVGMSQPTGNVVSNRINWTDGDLKRNFIFNENSGNKVFEFKLTGEDLNYNNNRRYLPFFGSINGVTSDAINFAHNTEKIGDNNSIAFRINWPVSKIGFVIQDLDSAYVNNRPSNGLAYAEYARINNNGSLSFFPAFHTRSQTDSTTTVTAKNGENCKINECNIDATWGYTSANSEVSLIHGVEADNARSHTVGYSDFYFCLAPPKLIIKKELSGNRVNSNDQFEINVKRTDGKGGQQSFTTTGSGSNISNGISPLIELNNNMQYTITERVVTGSGLGDIDNYNARYVCTNSTNNSTTVMPTSAMSYDPNTKTRSFILSDANYGDEITCTITNTPSLYTFSGTVFNDNGGLTGKTSDDLNGIFISQTNYFNGLLDSNESGISGTTYPDLKIRLTNCSGSIIGNTAPQNVSSLGKYSFSVPASALKDVSEVCVVQTEPNAWPFTVDTTPNELKVNLKINKYDYKNINFGEVVSDQTALVLKKYQYVHQCHENLDYYAASINGPNISSPSNGFSMQPASDVEPGQCIAYKIEASNHGHLTLNHIRISDILQKQPIKSVFHLPKPSGISAKFYLNDDINSEEVGMGDNGVIISELFDLSNTVNSITESKRSLYFNTKYGTSVEAQ